MLVCAHRSHLLLMIADLFCAGADVNLEPCDPGDIDPHAVASLYKSYLRECECLSQSESRIYLVPTDNDSFISAHAHSYESLQRVRRGHDSV